MRPPILAAGTTPIRIAFRTLLVTTLVAAPALGRTAVNDADPAVTVEPAIAFAPDPPVAGRALQVTVAADLLRPGRIVVLRDAARGIELDRALAGRQAIRDFRFALPAGTAAIRVAVLDAAGTLLETPLVEVASAASNASTPSIAPGATESDGSGDPGAPAPDCDAPAPETDPDGLAAWLAGCPLDHAALRERDLRGADLRGRVLRRADLRGADLSDARLDDADLSGALLGGARLDGASLLRASLEVADLSHAHLFVTDLGGADLRGADLRQARLTDVNLTNADLTGARFDDAVLRGVDFIGARCPDATRTLDDCRAHLELP